MRAGVVALTSILVGIGRRLALGFVGSLFPKLALLSHVPVQPALPCDPYLLRPVGANRMILRAPWGNGRASSTMISPNLFMQ